MSPDPGSELQTGPDRGDPFGTGTVCVSADIKSSCEAGRVSGSDPGQWFWFLPQEPSSLPSVQSSSPSHCHTDGMQRPFPHWNWLASHSVLVPEH